MVWARCDLLHARGMVLAETERPRGLERARAVAEFDFDTTCSNSLPNGSADADTDSTLQRFGYNMHAWHGSKNHERKCLKGDAMASPFSGMDPYLEQFWRDVHASLVIYLRDQLQGRLPPDLRARVEERVFV